MPFGREARGMRRCRGCGSRLMPGTSKCVVCGKAEPWYLTGPGLAASGALAVVVLVLLVAVVWWRGRGPAEADQAARPTSPAVATRVVALAASAVPTPAARATDALPATATALPAASATPAVVTYTVVNGDNLWTISRRLGVDLAALSAANPGADQRLSIGQALIVPVTATPAGPELVAGGPGATDVAPTGPTATAGPTAPPEVYTVQAGDTLTTVAAAQGLTVADLVAMNEGELAGPEAVLTAGQTLRVRQAVPRAGDAAPVGWAFAAPWPLAPAHGVSVREDAPLLRWVSAGILPEDVYYVVSLQEVDAAGQPGDEALHWVASNATALALPAHYRPAPGGTRTLRWAVTVRRVAGEAAGQAPGEILCPVPEPRQFTWAP